MTKDDFLSHHGILGMKWGQRRFQNEDGTLTPEGRERYAKVAKSSRLRLMENKGGISVAKNTATMKRLGAKVKTEAAEKARSKGDIEKAKQYEKIAKDFLREADLMDKRASDIQTGKLQAGRDFILQRDYYVRPSSFLGSIPLMVVRGRQGKYIEKMLPFSERETTFVDRKGK